MPEIPELNLSESSDEDDEKSLEFAQIYGTESYFDSDGVLHLIFTFKQGNYSKDTFLNLDVGENGVLCTKVAPMEPKPQTSTCQCGGNCKDSSDSEDNGLESSPTEDSLWESPTKILKESFGHLNLSLNTQGELKEQVFKSPSTSSVLSSPKKRVSLSLLDEMKSQSNSEKENPKSNQIRVNTKKDIAPKKTVVNNNTKSKIVKEHTKRELSPKKSQEPSPKLGTFKDVAKDKRAKKPAPKSKAYKHPSQEKEVNEPKPKKYKRISIVSSSESESEVEPRFTVRNEKRSSSDSGESTDSEKKKPVRQLRKSSRSTILMAENFADDDIIQKVYRFEGVYWGNDKKNRELFNCFECKNSRPIRNVIEHFKCFHSALIAED